MTTTERQVRPWGVEIETPAVAQLHHHLAEYDWTFTIDQSVNREDCECDCESCRHSCNCPNCYWDEDDNEHCDDCSPNEAQSPIMTTATFSQDVRNLLINLASNDYETGQNGGHIHVNAPDLNARQIGTLQRVWHKIPELMPELVGRDYNHYASDNRPEVMEGQKKITERYSAINCANWYAQSVNGEIRVLDELVSKYNTRRKWTIEFRQFDNNANPYTIEERAQICRALVDYIADNRPIYWLERAETARELLDLLEPEKH